MKIALEVPISHLNEISQLTDFDFCLGPMAMKFKDYREFYINQKKSGREVWLDNGANEGKVMRSDKYLRLANEMNVDVIISPDHLNDKDRTISSFYHFLEFYSRMKWTNNKPTIAVVAQGENWEESRTCASYFSTLGVTICLPWRIKRNWRRDLTTFHFLGLNELAELSELETLPMSLDTSLPVRYAKLKRSLKDPISKGHLPILNDEFFVQTLTKQELELTIQNLEILRNVKNEKTKKILQLR